MYTKEITQLKKFIQLSDDGETMIYHKKNNENIECLFLFTKLQQRCDAGEIDKDKLFDELHQHLKDEHEKVNNTCNTTDSGTSHRSEQLQ